LRNFCSPLHTDSALYPTIGQIERAAGFRYDDAPQAKLDKLDALLAQSSSSSQDAALLSGMLSLPNDGRYPAIELTPQQRRQKTLEALVLQVAAITRQNPVLMIFEDAHWADPTSLELFDRIVDKIPEIRVLLIVTYRPEFEPPWIGRPHVTALTLNRLGQREIAAMIDRVAINKALSANIIQDIIERTDGIPLFVEEMTKAVLEVESAEATEHTVASVPRPAAAVPSTLHASLMARLDRLGSAKEVAQIGAAIGREFSHELITAITRKPEADLRASLERLSEAGLLFSHGALPHKTYLFKHALVRDAAYSTLLRGRRQELHRLIVSALQQNFPELVVSQPEVLARHSAESGMFVEAIEYYLLAAKRATAAMNNKEASAHLKRSMKLLEQLPASEPRKAKLSSLIAGAGWWLSS
jgi:predicted ATPase